MLRILFAIVLLTTVLAGCKKDDEATPTANSQTDLLVANNWITKRVTTPDGQLINRDRLNLMTQILFTLNMQFRTNGTVRALDPGQANLVINQGTWKLASDNQSIDVAVTGFSGNFPIVRLTRSLFILRQRIPVDGVNSDINLEFEPAL